MKLHNRIKEYREKLKMTKGSLAKCIGVDKTSVIYWERQQHQPDTDRHIKLSKVLGTTEQNLFPREDSTGKLIDPIL